MEGQLLTQITKKIKHISTTKVWQPVLWDRDISSSIEMRITVKGNYSSDNSSMFWWLNFTHTDRSGMVGKQCKPQRPTYTSSKKMRTKQIHVQTTKLLWIHRSATHQFQYLCTVFYQTLVQGGTLSWPPWYNIPDMSSYEDQLMWSHIVPLKWKPICQTSQPLIGIGSEY